MGKGLPAAVDQCSLQGDENGKIGCFSKFKITFPRSISFKTRLKVGSVGGGSK